MVSRRVCLVNSMDMCGHDSLSQKFIAYIAQFNKADMSILADLMQSGKMTPVIDRTYKLSETARRSSLSGRRTRSRKSRDKSGVKLTRRNDDDN